MSQTDRSLLTHAETFLDAARAAGASDADVIAIGQTQLSVATRAGALEQAERAEACEIGLRVLVGQRQACVSSSNLTTETARTLAERAVSMAAAGIDDPNIGLATPEQLARNTDMSTLDLYDPRGAPSPEALQEQALSAEAAAASVGRITQVEGVSANYGQSDVQIISTNGFAAAYRRSNYALSCSAIAGTGLGMERDYDGDMRCFAEDLRAAEEIGRVAAERAVARLEPKRARSGAFPVLFDERVSGSLIGHVLAAINGDAISRGASWLRDALDTAVLPKTLSLIEEPHRARISGSRFFDVEGLPTRRRHIIENGSLKTWTLDLRTGRKLGLASTANAARGLSGPPSPSAGNLSLTQGNQSREELIRDMGTGIYITSLIGSTINPNTGDYSRGASGFWVENGEIQYPVNECTIAGNLRDFLKTLIPGNDARHYRARVIPSLLVEGLTLASA